MADGVAKEGVAEMTENQEWVVLLVAVIIAALVCAVVGMGVLRLVEWIQGALHRRKTRRQRFRW